MTVVTKSGSLAGGANTYESAVIRLLTEAESLGLITLSCLVPREVPNAEGSVDLSAENTYPNTLLSKARSVLASTGAGRLISRVLPISPLAKAIRKLAPDLVYFASPNIHAMGLHHVPLLFTVWDLGHRELREFPEFSSKREYFLRERLYRTVLPRAINVLTDSRWTGRRLEEVYGLDADRWTSLGMAFTVSPAVNRQPPQSEKPYFLYPAQKWPHKNHKTLLNAFAKVLKERPEARLVLIGSAKTQGVDIDQWARDLGIGDSIDDLGFVDADTAGSLMAGASALVMPTFLGPTNLPPLEAASAGVYSVVSDVHHFDEDLSNHVSLVPANDPGRWAEEMLNALHREKPEAWRPNVSASDVLHDLLNCLLESKDKPPARGE